MQSLVIIETGVHRKVHWDLYAMQRYKHEEQCPFCMTVDGEPPFYALLQ